MSDFDPETYADARSKSDFISVVIRFLIEEFNYDAESALDAVYETNFADDVENEVVKLDEQKIAEYINLYILRQCGQ